MSTTPTGFCQFCGQPMTAASRFCSQCGQSQPSASGAVAGAAVAPAYAAPVANVAAPGTSVYGGFWVRFLAVIIDSLVVGVVTGPITLILQVAMGLGSGITRNAPGEIRPEQVAMFAGMFALIITISIAAHALYEALLTASSKQATVGKMVFRLKVTDMDGRRISMGRAFGRHFAKYISGMTLMIGYLIQPFTARRQALHDIICSTLVVKDVSVPYQIVPPQTAPPAVG